MSRVGLLANCVMSENRDSLSRKTSGCTSSMGKISPIMLDGWQKTYWKDTLRKDRQIWKRETRATDDPTKTDLIGGSDISWVLQYHLIMRERHMSKQYRMRRRQRGSFREHALTNSRFHRIKIDGMGHFTKTTADLGQYNFLIQARRRTKAAQHAGVMSSPCLKNMKHSLTPNLKSVPINSADKYLLNYRTLFLMK